MSALALVPSGPDVFRAVLTGMVLDSVSSVHSRDAYKRALDDFFTWLPAGAPFTKATVAGWKANLEREGYAPASVNQKLSAVRKLATEASDAGMIDPAAAAAIGRVKGAARHGVRSGNWLTKDQAQRTLLSPEVETMKGKRDRALLAVLFGTGLRRSEACALTMAHVQQREGRWVIADLVGKHQRVRTIPMPSWVKAAIDRWTDAAGIADGRVFRAVDKAGQVWGVGITPKVVRCITRDHAAAIGVERFSAHDARRTFAKLCRSTGGELEQIQLLLGHASIQTTERYLGTQLNIVDAANDQLRMRA